MEHIPNTKEEADEFLKMVEWPEGRDMFTELKVLAELGEPAEFSVAEERYPNAFMMICAEMAEHSLTFYMLFKKLTELWSDGKLSLQDNFEFPNLTFHLVKR
jgi:hypothetical protein